MKLKSLQIRRNKVVKMDLPLNMHAIVGIISTLLRNLPAPVDQTDSDFLYYQILYIFFCTLQYINLSENTLYDS